MSERVREGRRAARSHMSLVEHLEEFRRRLIVTILALAAGVVAGWYLAPGVLEFLLRPAREAGAQMVQLAAAELLWVYVRLAVAGGLVLASPLILYEAMAFLWPGLEPGERRAVLVLLPFAVVLFAAGTAFAYFLFLKYLFRFFLGFTVPGVTPTLSVGSYVSTVLGLILPFGLVFELPVLLALAARLGLVTHRFLSRNRKYAVLAIFIVAAVLTPPDPISQIVMAVPLLLLYEASLAIVRVVARRSPAQRPEPGAKPV